MLENLLGHIHIDHTCRLIRNYHFRHKPYNLPVSLGHDQASAERPRTRSDLVPLVLVPRQKMTCLVPSCARVKFNFSRSRSGRARSLGESLFLVLVVPRSRSFLESDHKQLMIFYDKNLNRFIVSIVQHSSVRLYRGF